MTESSVRRVSAAQWLYATAPLWWLPQAALLALAVSRLQAGGGFAAMLQPAAGIVLLGLLRMGCEAWSAARLFDNAREQLSAWRGEAVRALAERSPLDRLRMPAGAAASSLAEQAEAILPWLTRYQGALWRVRVVPLLILRPVAFKFRSKREDPAWRSRWDWALFVGGFVPALIFGVAMGNVLQGVPFRIASDMQIFYDGSFFGLLNPYALLAGLVSVAMLVLHGAAWLQLKTLGAVAERARRFGIVAGLLTTLLYALAGVLLATFVTGYAITSSVDVAGPSNPLLKSAAVQGGAWLANYAAQPLLWAVPVLGLAGPLVAALCLAARRPLGALLASGTGIAGIVASVGVSMFPFILPSSANPSASLTVWDASSSHLTLFIMLVSTLIFMPIILAYTSWVFSVLRGKVDADAIRDGKGHSY